jgi:hypothetical protein
MVWYSGAGGEGGKVVQGRVRDESRLGETNGERLHQWSGASGLGEESEIRHARDKHAAAA